MRDRWLLAIIFGAIILILASVLTVYATQDRKPIQYSTDTPVGVVQAYIVDLDAGRISRAREYLSTSILNQTEEFLTNSQLDPTASRRIVLISQEIDQDLAYVVIEITTVYRDDSGPGSSTNTQVIRFELKSERATWKIISPKYPPF